MLKKWLLIAPLTGIGIAGISIGTAFGYYKNSMNNEISKYAAIPKSSSNSDFLQCYFASAVNGTRLLIAPGYTHTSAIVQALGITSDTNNAVYKYMNKTGFLLLDDTYGMPIFSPNGKLDDDIIQPLWTSNVASIQFRTDLGSFITGIALGEFLNEYQYYFLSDDNKLTWGTYGGDSFSSVTSFMGGLQKGINWFNEHIVPYVKTANGASYHNIEQILIGDSYNANFSGGFAITQGDALINQFLAKNVDALLPVAGVQYQQAVRLIKQQNSKTILLGVDSATENDTNSNLKLSISGTQNINGSNAIGGTNDIIQFSSLKKLDIATDLILTNINNGVVTPINSDDTTTFNTIGGLGYRSLGTIENNCVGVSSPGYQYFIRAMKLFVASYGCDPDNFNLTDTTTNSQQQISIDYLKKIFAIPNNNPAINIPTSSEYSSYYNDELVKKYTDVLLSTSAYKNLSDSSEKYYSAGSKKYFYSDIPNSGSEMMPLDETKLPNWFMNNIASNPNGNINNLVGIDKVKYDSLLNWFEENLNEVSIRKNFNLKNKLTKQAYEDNHSVIKIALNSPDVPLMDKSFNQSAYYGLVLYWKTFGINLPVY